MLQMRQPLHNLIRHSVMYRICRMEPTQPEILIDLILTIPTLIILRRQVIRSEYLILVCNTLVLCIFQSTRIAVRLRIIYDSVEEAGHIELKEVCIRMRIA